MGSLQSYSFDSLSIHYSTYIFLENNLHYTEKIIDVFGVTSYLRLCQKTMVFLSSIFRYCMSNFVENNLSKLRELYDRM